MPVPDGCSVRRTIADYLRQPAGLTAGPERDSTLQQTREFSAKAGRQVVKDYVAFPALTALSPAATYKSTLKAKWWPT